MSIPGPGSKLSFFPWRKLFSQAYVEGPLSGSDLNVPEGYHKLPQGIHALLKVLTAFCKNMCEIRIPFEDRLRRGEGIFDVPDAFPLFMTD